MPVPIIDWRSKRPFTIHAPNSIDLKAPWPGTAIRLRPCSIPTSQEKTSLDISRDSLEDYPRGADSRAEQPGEWQMGALSGLRIVELAENVAGEYCGKLLADFGAEVIKVERPGSGSPTRAMAPVIRRNGGSPTSA